MDQFNQKRSGSFQAVTKLLHLGDSQQTNSTHSDQAAFRL